MWLTLKYKDIGTEYKEVEVRGDLVIKYRVRSRKLPPPGSVQTFIDPLRLHEDNITGILQL